ncbi:hypothetical protein Tco_0450969 [Tanacetum coccineum]
MDMNENNQSQNHVHTKIIPAISGDDDDKAPSEDTTESSDKKVKKCLLGNLYFLHPKVDGKAGEDASIHDPVLNGCDFKNLQCLKNQNFMLNDFPACATEGDALVANPSGG